MSLPSFHGNWSVTSTYTPRPNQGITLKALWQIAKTKAPVPVEPASFDPSDMQGPPVRGVPTMRVRDIQGLARVLKAAGWNAKQIRRGQVRVKLWYWPPADEPEESREGV